MADKPESLDVKAAEALAKAGLEMTKPAQTFTWEAFKKKVLQFFGGLIMEQ